MPLLLKPVPPSRGSRWIADAFRLFGRRPLAFTLLFTMFLIVAMVLAQLPLIGGPLQLGLLPLLSLGFMIASRSALLDGPVHPGQLIEALKPDAPARRRLVVLCVIYGLAAFAILALADWISGHAMARMQALMAQGAQGAQDPETQRAIDALLSEPRVGRALLIGLALGVMLSIPFWHAPALVHWGAQGVGQALFSSTLALWRCKGAFFMYFVTWLAVVMLFGLLSALLLGALGAVQLVGLVSLPAGLMFSTVFYVSLIFTFNDSFGSADMLTGRTADDSGPGESDAPPDTDSAASPADGHGADPDVDSRR
jgi:hypothetical protein